MPRKTLEDYLKTPEELETLELFSPESSLLDNKLSDSEDAYKKWSEEQDLLRKQQEEQILSQQRPSLGYKLAKMIDPEGAKFNYPEEFALDKSTKSPTKSFTDFQPYKPTSGMAETLPTRSGVDFSPSIQNEATLPLTRGIASDKKTNGINRPVPAPSIPAAPTKPQEDTELLEAQRARGLTELINRLGKSSEIIGSAISRTKPVAQQAFDENIRAAGAGVENLLQRRKESDVQKERTKRDQERDPGSQKSKDLASLLKQFTGAEYSGRSYEELKDLAPTLTALYEKQENRRLKEMEIASKKEMDTTKEAKEGRKFADAARKEIQKTDEYKSYVLANKATETFDKLAKNPTDDGFQDFARTMIGAKTLQLDNSVVRDSERAAFGKAGGFKDFLENVTAGKIKGTSLTRNQREQIANVVKTIRDVNKASLMTTMEPVLNSAEDWGSDTGSIISKSILKEDEQKPTGTIRVKAKSGPHAGKIGTIPEKDFDPSHHEKL